MNVFTVLIDSDHHSDAHSSASSGHESSDTEGTASTLLMHRYIHNAPHTTTIMDNLNKS